LLQLVEKRQPRGSIREQHRDDGKIRVFGFAVQRLEAFQPLPRTRTARSKQDDDGVGIGDRVGQRRNPEGAGAEIKAVEEDTSPGACASSALASRRAISRSGE
jgi:hypothetical protein